MHFSTIKVDHLLTKFTMCCCYSASGFGEICPNLQAYMFMSQMGNNKNGWVWQWDVQASERRELATKKAALATAEIVNLSKCIPSNCQS